MAKFTDFNKHRPADRSDPGFTLPGFKLRWVNGAVNEGNPGRIWKVLTKSDLPEKLVKYIEDAIPETFRERETIRRGGTDLTLHYASLEEVDRYKKELAKEAYDMARRINATPQGSRDMTVQAEFTKTTMTPEKFKQ